MSSSVVDRGQGRTVAAAFRWALVGVAAGTVVSGFRVLSGYTTAPGVRTAPRAPTPPPARAPEAARSPSTPVVAVVPPPLAEHERVLVTVASPAGTPYRPPAPVLMRLPARPIAAPGIASG